MRLLLFVAFLVASCWLTPIGAVASKCSLQGVNDADREMQGMINLNSDEIAGILAPPFSYLPFVVAVGRPFIRMLETPIQFRLVVAGSAAMYSVASAYDPVALEIGGRVDVSETRRVYDENCSKEEIRLHLKVAVFLGFTYFFAKGLPQVLTPSIEFINNNYDGVFAEAYDLMLSDDFDACSNLKLPWGLARCVTDEVLTYVDTYDGWNALGTLNRTWNVQPYSDFNFVDAYGKVYTKYKPRKGKKFWKPLVDADELGYFRRQEHVTPYIGMTGKLFGIDRDDQCTLRDMRRAPNPRYKFDQEMEWVFEQTRLMASDERKQMLVEAFDSKFSSLVFLTVQWAAAQGLDELEFWKLDTGMAVAIYNGIVLVWREKIRHNLVRPTTLAEGYDDDEVRDTYAGVPGSSYTIPVNEWEPYIRVMPHTEYPSGSACMCRAYSEFLTGYSGSDKISPPGVATLNAQKGSSKIFPGQVPSEDLSFQFDKWSEISDACSKSRTDGGMHFEASLDAGEDLCSGLADNLLNRLDMLTEGKGGGGLIDFDDTYVRVCPLD